MKYFYLLMLEASRFEYVIGRASGMNPNHLAQLSRDIIKWEGLLILEEICR